MKTKHYELTVIFDGDLQEESAEEAINEVETTLTDLDSDIVNLENWGKREFEYSMEGKDSGYYAFFLIDAPTNIYEEIQTPLKLNDAVLRHLLVKASDWKIERAKAAEEEINVEEEEEISEQEPETEEVEVDENQEYDEEPEGEVEKDEEEEDEADEEDEEVVEEEEE